LAWQAKLSTPVQVQGEQVIVTFDFYDLADTGTILATQSFTFSPYWTANDMAQAVQSAGTRLKAAHDKSTTLAASYPVGTTINIP
jgi:hypothetical protein